MVSGGITYESHIGYRDVIDGSEIDHQFVTNVSQIDHRWVIDVSNELRIVHDESQIDHI